MAFAINVVALFARLRLVADDSLPQQFQSMELTPSAPFEMARSGEGRNVFLGALAALASFALFHLVTVFPLSWMMLYGEASVTQILGVQVLGALIACAAVVLSGWMADRFGRRNTLGAMAVLIGLFSFATPMLLHGGTAGQNVFILVGFTLLGLSYGQSSGTVTANFSRKYRFVGAAYSADVAWLLGAAFAAFGCVVSVFALWPHGSWRVLASQELSDLAGTGTEPGAGNQAQIICTAAVQLPRKGLPATASPFVYQQKLHAHSPCQPPCDGRLPRMIGRFVFASPTHTMTQGQIRIRGARQHNLQNVDLDIRTGESTVVTGPSGSGKSSLVFDTLFAEGQRRYVETFSAYARQFLDRMDKPAVDEVEGVPPAIAIDQTNPVRNSRSTVGTMTELNDHLKLLFARAAPPVRPPDRACPCSTTRPRPFSPTCSSAAKQAGDPRIALTFPVELPANTIAGRSGAMAVGQRLHQGAGRARSRTCRPRRRAAKGKKAKARRPKASRCWTWWPTAFASAAWSAPRAMEAIEVALKRGNGHLTVYVMPEEGEARTVEVLRRACTAPRATSATPRPCPRCSPSTPPWAPATPAGVLAA